MIFCEEEEEERTSEESIGFGYGFCSKTEFLANRFPDVFSGSSFLIILRQFGIKTFVSLYFFNKCRGVIRVARRHLKRVYGREVNNQVLHGICPNASVASIV